MPLRIYQRWKERRRRARDRYAEMSEEHREAIDPLEVPAHDAVVDHPGQELGTLAVELGEEVGDEFPRRGRQPSRVS